MTVGIDAQSLGSGTGGIESYVNLLVRALAATDPEGDYTLLLSKPLVEGTVPGAERFRQVVVEDRMPVLKVPFPGPRGVSMRPFKPPSGAFQRTIRREGIDVVHVQMAAPAFVPARIVVTLHDIVFERFPQLFPRDHVLKLKATVPLTLRRAAQVLTVSEFSKRDIARRYRVDPDKITVAHGGPDAVYRPLHDERAIQRVRERYGIEGPFILYMGNLDPHKNLRRLIEAYVRLRQADTIRHKLVLGGQSLRLEKDTEAFAAARASGYGDDLVFAGYVPQDDLVALYNAADLFVFPSLFEGLGLPPLEAMACGTPVVTSTAASLPEVVRDAALTVDPYDTDALAQAIADALTNRSLHDDLAGRGLRRAADYAWDRAARTIIDVYQRAMGDVAA